MNTKPDTRALAVVNAVTYLGMLVVNILATSLPLNNMSTDDLSDALPNLFVPSGLTFSIWGVIWILLAVYLVAQLRVAFTSGSAGSSADAYSPAVVGLWFPANMVLNAGWIFAWHYQLVGVSVLIMLVLLATLIVMFLRLDRTVRAGGAWFARVPVAVYFGWITIATIANLTAFLVSVGWNGFGVPDTVWTIVVIAAGLGVNLAILLRHRSYAFAAVAVWAFAGIAIKRIAEGTPEGPAVLVAAIVAGAAIVVVGVFVALRGRARS